MFLMGKWLDIWKVIISLHFFFLFSNSLFTFPKFTSICCLLSIASRGLIWLLETFHWLGHQNAGDFLIHPVCPISRLQLRLRPLLLAPLLETSTRISVTLYTRNIQHVLCLSALSPVSPCSLISATDTHQPGAWVALVTCSPQFLLPQSPHLRLLMKALVFITQKTSRASACHTKTWICPFKVYFW